MFRLWAPVLALTLAFTASLPAAAQSLREVRQVEGVTEYALPNGLTVLFQPDASKATTTVAVTYRVGSRHEGQGETGAAHLLEHMVFRPSRAHADPKAEMSRRGASWNGTTNQDRTNYFAVFPENGETLQWMIGWLADSMTGALLRKEDLDAEMNIVRNELERGENGPGGVLHGRMMSAAYRWHGYGRAVIGARSDIENIPIERLRAFYRAHYRPDNALLVVGGKFDATLARAAIEKTFGAIAKPEAPLTGTWTREPAQEGEREVVLRRQGGAPIAAVMYRAPATTHRDSLALGVYGATLLEERGPVEKTLLDTKIAASRTGLSSSRAEGGEFGMLLTLPDGSGGEAAARAAVAKLEALLETHEPDTAAVDFARRRLLQVYEAGLRSPEGSSLSLGENWAAGDWRLLFLKRDWIETVTARDVIRAARTWLVPANRIVGLYVPQPTAVTRAPEVAPADVSKLLAGYTGRDRKEVQDPGLSTPDQIERRLVKGRIEVGGQPGLRTMVLPRDTKGQRVTGLLRLRWGTAETLLGQGTLASFAGPLLMQGTADMDSQQLRQKLLALDANLGFSTSGNGLNASFEAPAERVGEVLQLMAELLQHPAFPATAFERMRTSAITATRSAKSNPGAVAELSLRQAFTSHYPPGDLRRSQTPLEHEEALKLATPEQLHAYWKRFAGANEGELVVIGPVEAERVAKWAKQAFGPWRSKEAYAPVRFDYPVLKARFESLPVPGMANATYTARVPVALNEESPDLPALAVAVHLLGGDASSSLWQRVREKEGLSYSVGARLIAQPGGEGQASALAFSASFAPKDRDQLRSSLREEVGQRLKQGFSDEEVARARATVGTRRQGMLLELPALAGLLAENARWGRDMGWYAAQTKALDGLDGKAVSAALAKYLDLDRLAEAAAGSFAP